ncbi:MAG: hypothetical protein M1828_001653 [Chrysothrix sp. TS-e1954]|nr:MAG: hypothetical protein M1828_001653 [Chrysothrix sp. TS-e1954]
MFELSRFDTSRGDDLDKACGGPTLDDQSGRLAWRTRTTHLSDVSCQCLASDARPPCLSKHAKSDLNRHQFDADLTFETLYANNLCYCTTSEIYDGYEEAGQRSHATFEKEALHYPYLITGVVLYGQQDGHVESVASNDADGNEGANNSVANNSTNLELPRPPNEALCGNECSHTSDCSGPGGDQCSCAVHNAAVIAGMALATGGQSSSYNWKSRMEAMARRD